MPLTFAHPVAVLPLRRCGLPLSALVVGSMAPDLEYLMRLAPRSEISHTAAGLLLFCVPVGLIALWVLHRVWKRPVLALFAEDRTSPPGHRPVPFAFWPLSRLAVLGAAVLVGALTHLAWDSFTHEYGWTVRHVPVLSTPILRTSRGAVPLFKLLQHGSTAFGLTVLAAMALRHRGFGYVSAAGWRLLVLVCSTSAAAGLCVALPQAGRAPDLRAAQRLVGVSFVVFTAALIAEVTLLSLVWYLRERKPEPAI